MGFFFQNYSIASVIAAIVMIIILVLFNEATRRNKWLSIAVYIVLPIIIAVLIFAGVIFSPSGQTWFGWVKCISATVGVVGFMCIRFTKLEYTKFAGWFPFAILAINILEAVYRDFEVYALYGPNGTPGVVDEAGIYMVGGPWNIINGIAGILLILTLTGWMGVRVSKNKSRDMVWPDQLWFWIVAYDLWNVAYCYNCISTRAMYAGVVLLVSCTAAEFLFKRGVWLQHRAQTLAMFALFSIAVNYTALPFFKIEASYNPSAWLTVSILALVANVAVFVFEVFTIAKTKRNPIKEDIYKDLKDYKVILEANGLE